MSDSELRSLERRWYETGTLEDRQRYELAIERCGCKPGMASLGTFRSLRAGVIELYAGAHPGHPSCDGLPRPFTVRELAERLLSVSEFEKADVFSSVYSTCCAIVYDGRRSRYKIVPDLWSRIRGDVMLGRKPRVRYRDIEGEEFENAPRWDGVLGPASWSSAVKSDARWLAAFEGDTSLLARFVDACLPRYVPTPAFETRGRRPLRFFARPTVDVLVYRYKRFSSWPLEGLASMVTYA